MKRWGLGKRNRSLGNVYTLKNLTWHEHESMKFLVQGFILNSCQISAGASLYDYLQRIVYVSSTARTGALCRCANGSSVLGPWCMKSKVMWNQCKSKLQVQTSSMNHATLWSQNLTHSQSSCQRSPTINNRGSITCQILRRTCLSRSFCGHAISCIHSTCCVSCPVAKVLGSNFWSRCSSLRLRRQIKDTAATRDTLVYNFLREIDWNPSGMRNYICNHLHRGGTVKCWNALEITRAAILMAVLAGAYGR